MRPKFHINRKSAAKEAIISGLESAFAENDPAVLVRKFLAGTDIRAHKIIVIGFGKAAEKMYIGAKLSLGKRIERAAIIVPKHKKVKLSYPYLAGDHPLPMQSTLKSSEILLAALKGLKEKDVVIALISGGGSALFEVLRNRGYLDRYNEAVRCAMKSGVDIKKLNAIRYLFSKVKGGGLLKYTYPAKVVSLIISDVPGDDINVVASGPLAGPPRQEFLRKVAKEVGSRCNLRFAKIRVANIRNYKAESHIILRNKDFVGAVAKELGKHGKEVITLNKEISCTTDAAAKAIVKTLRRHYMHIKKPFFLVGGGETHTRVLGNGRGGRNLELCLKFLLKMHAGEVFTFGSFGTDGIDGNSGAMGAVVDQESLKMLSKDYIKNNLSKSESLGPLLKSGDVLFTGVTGTNVSDVFVAYYAGKAR